MRNMHLCCAFNVRHFQTGCVLHPVTTRRCTDSSNALSHFNTTLSPLFPTGNNQARPSGFTDRVRAVLVCPVLPYAMYAALNIYADTYALVYLAQHTANAPAAGLDCGCTMLCLPPSYDTCTQKKSGTPISINQPTTNQCRGYSSST